MAHIYIIEHALAEKKTAKFSGVIQDENGNGIEPTTITLTLFDRDTGAIVNSRTASDIKNTGGGTIDASGNWTLTLAPADMAILDATKKRERRTALIEWTYGAAKAGGEEIRFEIDNFTKIT